MGTWRFEEMLGWGRERTGSALGNALNLGRGGGFGGEGLKLRYLEGEDGCESDQIRPRIWFRASRLCAASLSVSRV